MDSNRSLTPSAVECMSTHNSEDFNLSELCSLDGEMETAVVALDDEVHRPVSPATPFESFFLLNNLRTNEVSAFALASQIRSSRSGTSLTSVATDEFGSAYSTENDNYTASYTRELFGKDVLIISREPIPEVSIEYEDTIMSQQEGHFDVAEHIYDGAKGVWAWGKGIAVIKPFLGMAEFFANTAVGIVGTNLEKIDGTIKPKLHEFDDAILNPSIAKIVEILMATAEKGDTTIRPVIDAILGPLGVKKIGDKSTDEVPEFTTKPIGRVS